MPRLLTGTFTTAAFDRSSFRQLGASPTGRLRRVHLPLSHSTAPFAPSWHNVNAFTGSGGMKALPPQGEFYCRTAINVLAVVSAYGPPQTKWLSLSQPFGDGTVPPW